MHSRLPEVGTSIFAVMSKMALDHHAINLSQGFPDFAIDDAIIDQVYRFMKDGNNQYAPMSGVPALRNSIAEVLKKTFGFAADAETNITITAGATEGLFAAISAVVGAGDEVIVFDPAYDSYNPAIRLNGGVPVHINLRYPDYTIDWDEVKRKISPRTKLIMINTPHNPCGVVLSHNDLVMLERIVLEHNLYVLSDEVYERLIYDGERHQSVLRFPGLANHSIAVFSFGKTFHATGWKAGYVVASEKITREIRKTHQFIVFSVNTPVQCALAEYLKTPQHYESLGQFYQQKRDYFLNGIKGSSFEPLACRGSYFQLLSYKNVSAKGDVAMAEYLTKEFKVASIPISVFYQDKSDHQILRFCFAKKEETLARACEILSKF
ncbi:methionine aminotransferase [Pseudochryseolinea flava]|uniref:Aminotransferase n=1 Tax=Pseudochryseolinea flava TaxID=2059302 RepID=A0A364YAZ1_9BACT|nr:methionine aminotransferase [Pseudochryseolinea flava]RAW02998.1 aminotransferase [Pseudochryseolinea flava]